MSNYNDLVGTELSRFSFTVERGKIREMVLAIGDDNPVYTDTEYARDMGYRDIIAPPTFGTCMDFWGGQDFMTLCLNLKINPLKVLHGGQEYRYLGEINPGDKIEARCTLKGFADKGKMHIFHLETIYQNQHGKTVLVSLSTVIERK